jgi:hypothetical protein|uniref:Uncharacterized protein n=1 Tax=viral metagenome TaxID=1070528 RepID=A0A6C0DPH4_9ZZZZ
MANRKTRRASKGLFGRVYSPLFHLVEASRNVGKSAFKRSGGVVNSGLGFLQNTGSSVAKHGDQMVSNILSRKNRKNRKGSRKNRKNTRKNRRN